METKRQKEISKPFLLIGVALIGLLSWVVTIFLITTKMQWQREPASIASQKKEWKTYQYFNDKKKFTFEYPADGKIKLENKFDEIPTITISSLKDGKEYTVVINTWHAQEYRGEFYSSREEKRQYENQLVTIKTIYLKKKPIAIVAIFENFADAKEAIQTISMDLSSTDVYYSLKIFNHLLSSLSYK